MAERTEYERQRAQRILENKRKMEEMGLLAASRGLATAADTAASAVVLEAGVEVQPRCKRRKAQLVQPAEAGPTRLSRRLRGETAPSQDEAAAAARAEAEAEGRARARAAGTRKRLQLEEGQRVVAPFSLWSIGVTIWELGRVHRGAWAHRYWSSPGCLYHHAYPVGYRATKVQFGRTYEMRIEEGPAGPVFKVTDQQSGAVFVGGSPTKPWTDVCVAHRTGQRISGPLFFGFSDPLTQRAIAANLYDAQELRAALHGEKLGGGSESSEEQAAKEFAAVEGVGEATAILLARTTALGGSRHASLQSLKGWAAASDGNAQALFAYLTGSEEVPDSTRRWPAWQQRLVPRIVLALSGRWLGAGPRPEPAADAAAKAAADAVLQPPGGPAGGDNTRKGEAGLREDAAAAAAEPAGNANCPNGASGSAAGQHVPDSPTVPQEQQPEQQQPEQQQQQPEQQQRPEQQQQQGAREGHLPGAQSEACAGMPATEALEQGAAAAMAAADARAVAAAKSGAKENRQTHNSRSQMMAAAPVQRSQRQRRANSKFVEFLVADCEDEVGEA